MITMPFLLEWSLRSAVLILAAAGLLRVIGIKDAAIRLSAWTALLCASLAIPAASALVPEIPITVAQASARSTVDLATIRRAVAAPSTEAFHQSGAATPAGVDWPRIALMAYVAIAAGLVARLGLGVLLSHRLLRRSRVTGRTVDSIVIRESDELTSPVTLGLVRPVIVLPVDWREWDGATLDAVLAHERSHIQRHDPAVQLLSALHRALIWHSPLSWMLHRNIVRIAEEASDDAAVAATRDRESYAQILLEFMQHGVRRTAWQGVAMARYGRPAARIHRILDGSTASHGVTRWAAAGILACGLPLTYVVAAAAPQVGPVSPVVPAPATRSSTTPAPAVPQTTSASSTIRRWVIFSGNSASGSWDSNDLIDQDALRSKYGPRFAWFRQGGTAYVVTDSGVLAELDKVMEPQKTVDRMQSGVNDLQRRVNQHQDEVNKAQRSVNSHQSDVNRRQSIINQLQAGKMSTDELQRLTTELADLNSAGADQTTVNGEQTDVNRMQSHVNAEQGTVNEQQSKVNQEQERVSGATTGAIEAILDSAVRRHLVQPVK